MSSTSPGRGTDQKPGGNRLEAKAMPASSKPPSARPSKRAGAPTAVADAQRNKDNNRKIQDIELNNTSRPDNVENVFSKNSNLFSSFVVRNKLQAGVSKKSGSNWQLLLKTALQSLHKEEVIVVVSSDDIDLLGTRPPFPL